MTDHQIADNFRARSETSIAEVQTRYGAVHGQRILSSRIRWNAGVSLDISPKFCYTEQKPAQGNKGVICHVEAKTGSGRP